MVIFFKVFYYSFFFLFFLLSIGCAKFTPWPVFHQEPPVWVKSVVDDNEFSVIGITEYTKPLKTAVLAAKINAIENLKPIILFKIEDLLLNITNETPLTMRKLLVKNLKKKIETELTYDYLIGITDIDSVWKSIDSNVLYVKIIANQLSIANKIFDILETMKDDFKNNNDIINTIEKIEYVLLYEDLANIKKLNNVIKNGNIKNKHNGKIIKNNISAINKKVKNNKNNKLNKEQNLFIEVLDDESNSWTIQDDEIDIKVNNINKIKYSTEKKT